VWQEETGRTGQPQQRAAEATASVAEAAALQSSTKAVSGSSKSMAQIQDSASEDEPCTSKVQAPPPKRRHVDTDDRLGAQLATTERETFTRGSAATMGSTASLGSIANPRSKAIQASRSLHQLAGSCKPLPVVEPVEVFEAHIIKRDPPVFDPWWMKRRSIFAARLGADASDVEIEAEARRCWDLLTDDLRRAYDVPMHVIVCSETQQSRDNGENVVKPGPPGLGRWLGLSGRRRKQIRIRAMFLPLYNDDGSFVPYSMRKRAEALRRWGNVSDKRRAKYAKTSLAQPMHV